MKKNKLLAIYSIIIIMAFILTFSIAVVILFRPFYYAHINIYDLTNNTPWDYQSIKTAYDEMLNYCIGLTNNFSTGILKYSYEGFSHFADCRKLFILDFAILAFTSLNILIYQIFKEKLDKMIGRFTYHSNGYYAGILTLLCFLSIGLCCAIDFDAAFTLMHKVLFPGKTNWLFDEYKDQIILILPEEFFRNCGIAIILIIFSLCIYLIIKDKKSLQKQ